MDIYSKLMFIEDYCMAKVGRKPTRRETAEAAVQYDMNALGYDGPLLDCMTVGLCEEATVLQIPNEDIGTILTRFENLKGEHYE